MKVLLMMGAGLLLPLCSHAQGAKACEDLKSEIAQKLDAKGVKSYSLEIVEKDKDAEGKVVGTCEGGTKKIVYRRSATSAEDATKQPSNQ
jgi:hypothetical protein